MKTGFKDQSLDVGDVYVTRDWLIDHYPELSRELLTIPSAGYGAIDGSGYLKGDGTLGGDSGLAETEISAPGNNRWINLYVDGPTQSTYMTYYGIRRDYSLWAWGLNLMSTSSTLSSMVQIGSGRWSMVSIGSSFAVGIQTDGSLWTWGSTSGGKTGDNGLAPTAFGVITSPFQLGTSSWTMVDVGVSATHAIRSDGTLWGWGYNGQGQIGDGTTINRSSPVQIGTDNNWVTVSSDAYTTFGIKSNGTLWGWGSNASGDIGDGTTINKSSPVQIGSRTDWRQVSRGAAITNSNELFVWGRGYSGRIGDGTIVAKSSPVQIGSSVWSRVFSSGFLNAHAAIKTDGTLWVWGVGRALGDVTTDKSSPVQIGTSRRWTTMAQGNYAMLAISDGDAIT